jgi:crotonobetainyl-CoA:carnitine CoA-transferase CaiB-like acyl-CoA transferase
MNQERREDELAYEGLRVTDLSQGVAGPHCGMLLALNGADVVKVEPPDGDWGRGIGRRYGDFSAYGVAFNRGKRSLCVDLKRREGRDVVARLVARADVVVENNRPGVLARFGLDYESVRRANANVVYVSVTGFGPDGPNSDLPATDSILQAYSGLMSVNRDAAGMPQRIGVLVIDVVTGLYAYQAVATALYRRATRGGGRQINVSLMDAIAAVQAGKMVEYALEGGKDLPAGVPVATFEAADGFININARRDPHFAALCRLLGLDELASDPRYATAAARLTHEAELMPRLRERIKARSMHDLEGALRAGDVLHAPVNDYGRYFDDAHVAVSGALAWIEHPGMGRIPLPRIPGLPHPAPGSTQARSPGIGEHTREVLTELGNDPAEVAALEAAGTVRSAHPGEGSDQPRSAAAQQGGREIDTELRLGNR